MMALEQEEQGTRPGDRVVVPGKASKKEQSWRRTAQAGTDGDTEQGQEAEDVMGWGRHKVTSMCQFARDHPGFGTASLVSRETAQSWPNWAAGPPSRPAG